MKQQLTQEDFDHQMAALRAENQKAQDEIKLMLSAGFANVYDQLSRIHLVVLSEYHRHLPAIEQDGEETGDAHRN